jgi:hypothetical protein
MLELRLAPRSQAGNGESTDRRCAAGWRRAAQATCSAQVTEARAPQAAATALHLLCTRIDHELYAARGAAYQCRAGTTAGGTACSRRICSATPLPPQRPCTKPCAAARQRYKFQSCPSRIAGSHPSRRAPPLPRAITARLQLGIGCPHVPLATPPHCRDRAACCAARLV